MDLSTMRDRLRRRVGNPPAAQVSNPILDQHINTAYVYLLDRFDHPAGLVVHPITVTANQASYNLPTGASSVLFVADASRGMRLRRLTPSNASSYAGRPAGVPTAYGRSGSKLVLYPTPNAAMSIQVGARTGHAKLVADTDVPVVDEAWHEGIIARAAYEYYSDIGDVAKAQTRLAAFNEWISTKPGDSEAEMQDVEYIVELPTVARDNSRRYYGSGYFRNNMWQFPYYPE